VQEEFISKYFVLKSNPRRYGSLVASVQNNFISRQDKYPKMLSKAYDMIVNYVNPHKQGGTEFQEHSMSFYQEDKDRHQARGRGHPGHGISVPSQGHSQG
jgi:hypothetical protein